MFPRRPFCRMSSRLATGHRLSRSGGYARSLGLFTIIVGFKMCAGNFAEQTIFLFLFSFLHLYQQNRQQQKKIFVPTKTQKKRPLEDSRISSFGLFPFDKTIMWSELTSPFPNTTTQSSSHVLRNPRRPSTANPPNNPRSRLD